MARQLGIDSPLSATDVIPLPITAWIPVSAVPRILPEWPEDFNDCCQQLQKSMSKVLRHLDSACNGSAVWVYDEKDVPASVMSLNPSAYSIPDYLRFLKIECSFVMRAGDVSHSDGKPVTIGDLIGMGASIFADVAQDVFLLASVAYPGRFHTRIGQVFVGPNPLNPVTAMPGFNLDNLYSTNPSWPRIDCKRLTQVITWEEKVRLFRQDVATTSVQRALACYTHLQQLTFNDAYSMLFFAMQGLEAFYCRGFGDLRRQLAEKCRLFLGEWPTRKNIVGELYNIRSSFVHGDYPIQRANPRHGLSDRHQKRDDAVTDAAGLATRLLIASLHKCIEQRITSVEFDWRVRTNRLPLPLDE